MLDIKRINERLREIRRRVYELQSNFQNFSEEELLSNETAYNAAEHHLQIAIQACIDIASHIVATLGLPAPSKETAEVFKSLAREKIITDEFAKVMKDVVSYRNVIVHGYLEVNRHITYENIQKHYLICQNSPNLLRSFWRKNQKVLRNCEVD